MTTKIIRKETLVKITKRDFEQYARLWGERKINMLDIGVVKRHSRFSELKILALMGQYEKLCRLYPYVWRKIKKERDSAKKQK